MVKGETKPQEPCSRDYTVHLHKRLHGVSFKKRAPKAISVIRDFTSRVMKTKDVRIDAELNRFLWSHGIKNVPYRVRVRMSRKKNEDDNAGEQMYTLVQHVDIKDFRKLRPERVVDK